ncbi:hypothetical protein PUNSTDRAFT_141970 [Punctularia strigosozonata HHB-11173 SS5]|uniref:uncharacterized protein n=1 Tax=Punctularia strigosozonata (strain HHB-11173) TaxID=741275 RepID=UPI00044184A0|nr:uncharacterized protein PUNSTDRAFT_141970 [Punctularia strigosozonata HHB-11173 SS5]EIN11692.1 hypothetical protein PUNSTDRAFT_141970 [Punctularia strigosozonata HHB-11173 SS5]
MKRASEKQLTQDNADEDDVEEVAPPVTGIQRADETVLATRKIRALPKRFAQPAAATNPAATSGSEAPAAPRFSGFAGFGVPAAAATPFSFKVPAPPATTNGTDAAAPSVSTSASTATKTFASFLSAPTDPTPTLPPPNPASAFPSTSTSASATPASSTSTSKDEEAALKLYKSLRGINVSLLSAISKAVEKDPFADISNLLEQYRQFRVTAQKEYDERPKSGDSHPASTAPTPPAPAASTSTPDVQPPSTSTAMPAPPPSFTGFSASASSKSGESSDAPAPAAPAAPPKSAFPASTSTEGSSSDAPPKPLFHFAGTSGRTEAPFTFGSKEASKPPPFFGVSSDAASKPSFFGSNGASTSTAFGGGAPPSAFTFGNKPADPAPAFGVTKDGAAATSSPDNKPAFTFGAGAGTTFGGFSPPKPIGGALGNAVGFAFGSPPKTPDADPKPPASSAFGNSGFNFARPPDPAAAPKSEDKEGSAEGADAGAGARGNAAKLLGNNPHDGEGAGEEDEETTHAIKSKLYKFVKQEEESSWTDMGVGILRLKKHKETGVRRVLMRNSSTGKVLVNFKLHSGLKPTLAEKEKVVAFVGPNGSGAASFKIRLKTLEQAAELKEAMDREIAFVKGGTEK